MSAPQELKDQAKLQYHTAVDSAVDGVVDAIVDLAHDAGAASVPQGGGEGGFTQAQVDQMLADLSAQKDQEKVDAVNARDLAVKEAAKLVVDSHDANTQVDQDLKGMIDAIVIA